MGFKRPFDGEEFHEFSLKHSRQLGCINSTTVFDEVIPRHTVFPKPVAMVNEGNLCKSQGGDSSDDETFDEEPNCVSSVLDMDDAFTWVAKGCGGGDTTRSSHSVKYFELGIPPKVFAPVENFYSLLLDQPARKQVPIGPVHQAEIPEWEGGKSESLQPSGMTFQGNIVECADSEKLSDTCVIPSPGLKTPKQMDDLVGRGREVCVCQDMGSIRCVRQHIKEAREEMVKMLGYEKFKDLGLCDMGEEIEQKWSEKDAQLFHEIVYSNPVSLGRNFWEHLAVVFHPRTKNEIVSYYFNVFILRRRATQNRTLILDIDSDDDEWHGDYADGEDSTLESSSLHQRNKVSPVHEDGGKDSSKGERDADNNAYVDTGEGCTGMADEYKMNITTKYMDRYIREQWGKIECGR